MNSLIEGTVTNTSGELSTYFYSVFEKTSNFSFQPLVIEFDTQTRYGDFMYAKMPNRGQRILNIFLKLGSIPLHDVEVFEILIDRNIIYSYTGEYIYIHNEIRRTVSKRTPSVVIVPIMKFFPVLENTQFRIKIKGSGIKTTPISILVDWVFDKLPIDGDYVVTQVQTINANPTKPIFLNFKNIVKELFFVVQDTSEKAFEYRDQIKNLKLDLNGNTKFDDRGQFFRYLQPMQYHTGNSPGIYMYSFCLHPEEDAPSGGINFSRIWNSVITVTMNDSKPKQMRIYAISYNVLRVENNKGFLLLDNI